MGGHSTNKLRYIDDSVLHVFAENTEYLQRILDIVEAESEKKG